MATKTKSTYIPEGNSRAKLYNAVSNFHPYDWGYFHKVVVAMLQNMMEYWLHSDNCFSDPYEREITAKEIAEVLDCCDAYEDDAKKIERFYSLLGERLAGWWD